MSRFIRYYEFNIISYYFKTKVVPTYDLTHTVDWLYNYRLAVHFRLK